MTARVESVRRAATARVVVAFLVAAAVLPSLASHPALGSNDPLRPRQWALELVGAPRAWAHATGSGVTIAIVDTGLDLDHEDLKGKLVPGINTIDPARPPQDDHGHGSHVAGIAAAETGNGRGIAGIAPAARLMPVRALASDCPKGAEDGCGAGGSVNNIAAGIRWAADNGAHVVNLSIGGDVLIRNVLGSSLSDAVNYAWEKGTIPVIAAGNEALFPSGYGDLNAIVVVATDRSDRKASYSNTASGTLSSAKWAMAAPGGNNDGQDANDIVSTIWSSRGPHHYGWLAGTSMATPHVAGAAAVLRSQGLTPLQVVTKLLESAKDLGPRGVDSTYGAGRLDVEAAVRGATTPGGTPAPSPNPVVGTAAPPALPRTSAPGRLTRVGTPAPTSGPGTESSLPPDAAPEEGASSQDGSVTSAAGSPLGSPAPERAPRPSSSRVPVAAGLAGLLLVAAGGLAWRIRS